MRFFKVMAVLAMLGLAGPAGAAVYKCVGPDGKTSWSDRPCTVYPSKSATPEAEAPAEVAPEPDVAPAAEPAASAAPAAVAAPATPSEPAQPELSPEEQEQAEQEQFEQDMAAFEAEFARRLKSRTAPMLLAVALMLAAWIWHVVVAVRMDKIIWAICLFLFSPLSNIPFTALNWQKAKVGFFVYLAGFLLMGGTVVSLYTGLVPPGGT